jgi:prephenate dehydrogenase
MSIQLTILGLGQIGASAGMALDNHKDSILRIGHDKDRSAATLAKDNGAVDKTVLTLSGAVKDADIVLLALPLHELYPVLEHICQDIKENTLLVDTSPLKAPLFQWAEEHLPDSCQLVGFTPVISADYLEESEFGAEAAHEDLFKGNLIGITAGKNASTKAINMAANFAQLLGAEPYFSDPIEIDGLTSMVHLTPQILSAALLKASIDTPGWREARKIAGKPYYQLTQPFDEDELPGALASAIFKNPENTTRLINDLIRVLVDLRDLTETPDEAMLEDSLIKLQQDRDLWLGDRKEGRWIDTPQVERGERRGVLSQLLGFREPKGSRDEE